MKPSEKKKAIKENADTRAEIARLETLKANLKTKTITMVPQAIAKVDKRLAELKAVLTKLNIK